MEGRQTLRKQLLSQLMGKAGEWWLVEELKHHVGASNDARSVRRALTEIFRDSATTGVDRRPIKGGRGRAKFEYSYRR